MRAFFIDAPNQTSFGEVAFPELADDHVLLKVERVGLCGSDLNTFRGLNPLVSFPRIPGHEIAGTIVRCGSAVPDRFRPGQLVTLIPYQNCGHCVACKDGRINACTDNRTMGVQREGAITEHIAVAHRKLVSTRLTDLNALALIEPLAVGFHAVARAAVTARDRVAVFGCGAIGLGVIAGCVARGAEVIAVDIDDQKLDLAAKVGARHRVNAQSVSAEAAVRDLTGGDGVSVAIEAVGLPQTFVSAVSVAAPLGRVVYVGYSKDPVSYETKYFLMKELDIRGSRGALRADFEEVVAYLESGRYPVEATVTKVFAFDQAGLALKEWSANPALVTKFMIDMNS